MSYPVREIDYILTPGDSLLFSAQLVHHWENMFINPTSDHLSFSKPKYLGFLCNFFSGAFDACRNQYKARILTITQT
ncbi:MAG: hypothetical protein GX421_12210 [Caldisericales bacterium]|nr:hypothetical protein [Caldisericales bacterium]